MSEPSGKKKLWPPAGLKRFTVKPATGPGGEDPSVLNPFEQLRQVLSKICVPGPVKGILEALPKLPENIYFILRDLIYININVAINWPAKDKTGQAVEYSVIPSMEAAKEAADTLSNAIANLQAKGGRMFLAEPAAAGTAETFLSPDKEKSFQRLKREYKLLAAPDVVLRVMDLAQDPDSSASQMVAAVENDPAIAARVLQYANSPYSGTRHRFDSLQGAIIHLGFERLIGLALDVSMKSQNRPHCPGFDYELFWNRSSATAAAARQVAPMFGEAVAPVVAFTAGLLGRIGELAYASTFPAAYSVYLSSTAGAPEETPAGPLSNPAAKSDPKKIALTPVELSARLLADWKLPRFLYCAVLHRDDAHWSGGDGEETTMVKILRWAFDMADVLTSPEEVLQRTIRPMTDGLIEQLGVKAGQFATAFNGSIENWKVFGRLLNVKTREVPPWPDILQIGV